MLLIRLFSILIAILVVTQLVREGVGDDQQRLDLMSIVDQSSWLAALIKDFSIFHSSGRQAALHFNYLVIDSQNFTAKIWNQKLEHCLNVSRTIVTWRQPAALKVLSNKQFEIDAIFARFYLPLLFPTLTRFLYIDNDAVVNVDVAEIIARPLHRYTEVPPVPHQPMANNVLVVHSTSSKSGGVIAKSKVVHRKRGNAAVGLVYETHPFYRSYFSSNFNTSHPLFQQVAGKMEKDAFLNAGVFVVDCVMWKARNYTLVAEELVSRNRRERIYSSSVGDQGVFYLMLGDDVSYLPAQYNMRRSPKKTFHMLEAGFQGVVHFAGTTRGDAYTLCKDPLQYPFLLNAALPLYLSVVHSFAQSLSGNMQQELSPFTHLCDEATQLVLAELESNKLKVVYNPGIGGFTWPPRKR